MIIVTFSCFPQFWIASLGFMCTSVLLYQGLWNIIILLLQLLLLLKTWELLSSLLNESNQSGWDPGKCGGLRNKDVCYVSNMPGRSGSVLQAPTCVYNCICLSKQSYVTLSSITTRSNRVLSHLITLHRLMGDSWSFPPWFFTPWCSKYFHTIKRKPQNDDDSLKPRSRSSPGMNRCVAETYFAWIQNMR